MYDLILSFITAFALTYMSIPSVINVARVKRLFDEPGERRSHTVSTPSLGGVAIFAGLVFSATMWTPFNHFADLQYILCALIIIFLIGIKDDIVPMTPYRKFAGQIFAAFILVYKANVKITSFYGLFGLYALPEWFSVILSVFTIILIINAFNLIDGVNGLAGSLGALISFTFGIWFFLVEKPELAIVAVALTGAIVAFLKYNYTPAKIFMGDTGSLLIGLVCAMLALKFMESHNDYLVAKIAEKPYLEIYKLQAIPAVTIGILIIPLFDTLRVFTLRILKGKSPFFPDRTHIHHLLLDMDFSHMQSTGILVVTNIIFVLIAYFLQSIGTFPLLIVILGLAVVASTLLSKAAAKNRAKKLAQ